MEDLNSQIPECGHALLRKPCGGTRAGSDVSADDLLQPIVISLLLTVRAR